MENKIRIVSVIEWIQPFFGNRHTIPYGKLKVTDGVTTKIVETKGDTVEDWPKYGCQYIIFKRKPYRLVIEPDGFLRKMKLEAI